MDILIIGADGQLGSEITKLASVRSEKFKVHAATINDFDITDFQSASSHISNIRPDVIINCAAYTKVDDCESNIDMAYRVNALGSRNVSLAAGICGSSVVYIGTDYIFDGAKGEPYNEFDMPCPLNTYGRSKLAGEGYVKDITEKHFIIRTSWLYGITGSNFVKSIIRLSKENSSLRIVDDQVGCPTDVHSLAAQILHILENGKYGTYHATCNGQCSWYEFAAEIVEILGLDVNVIPIETKDYPLPAKRPKFSVLDNYILRIENEDMMPHWKDSIKQFLNHNSLEELK
ncbi:MAG: dTDP-4-dehydrorhamnose reductase [Candidatus Dadabacteria bacterium]|nr:dTDP-4-dehydrorhamnose reductase [Candidatus Dadabacteria bacterium]NIS07991.1 dTDP-4-dehydrorhamnose reductase [Candidatus Dadabacteria bacterium]NIV41908.1 dTDP-4-dehydrorhamnose reductase [Candidatus Dadabacteria bacterium]NIX16360.1 dTDP-4-dehydrorhamnose reductase [Candidatus Dadabacteria bacterium]NIY22959.1 dTDP-4-dehydrorhamnose reductase [Candidatus Dadabacteria bacterium]